MSEEQPRILYIRASPSENAHTDLAGLLGRITREAIASNNQRFILQLAHDQHVLDTLQAWKTLKQVSAKQGMAMVIAGGSEEVREMANAAGFPIVGTAEFNSPAQSGEVEALRTRVMGYTVPQELGELDFEEWARLYRQYESAAEKRKVGGFVDFVRLSKGKKDNPLE